MCRPLHPPPFLPAGPDTRLHRGALGYSSSLAAAGLHAIGLHRATDLTGGVEAWLAAGLPTTSNPADVRE